MIVLLDNGQDLAQCEAELGCRVGQLLTPLTRYRLREPDRPWAIDNGAFAGFDRDGYLSLLEREADRASECLFVTLPDVVESARRTLEVFYMWRRVRGFDAVSCQWKLAYVCQDGQEDIPVPWEGIDAIFIGGSTAWKVSKHAVHCIRAAQALGKWTHVGRVNDPSRFDFFEKLGVDSVDGTGIARYSHMRDAIAKRDNQGRLV